MSDKKYDMHITGKYLEKNVPCTDAYGKDLTREESQDLAEWMNECFKDFEVTHEVRERKEQS